MAEYVPSTDDRVRSGVILVSTFSVSEKKIKKFQHLPPFPFSFPRQTDFRGTTTQTKRATRCSSGGADRAIKKSGSSSTSTAPVAAPVGTCSFKNTVCAACHSYHVLTINDAYLIRFLLKHLLILRASSEGVAKSDMPTAPKPCTS